MNKEGLILALFFVLFVVDNVFASRPLSTDDAYTIENGKTEIELGYDFVGGTAGEDNTQMAVIQVGHGITEKMDIKVVFPYSVSPARGAEGVLIGLKLTVLSEAENIPSAAVSVFTEPGQPEYSVNGIISKTLGSVSLYLNFGYESTGVPGEQGGYTCSIAGDYNITENISIGAEIIDSTEEKFIHHNVTPFIGARFSVAEWITIDAGTGINFSKESRLVHVTSGLTLKI